jgi:3-hydroxybutyryl-CoA dehydrogenase
MSLLNGIGSEPVRMKKEIPGFICNRIMHAMIREALYLVQEDVLSAEDVDRAILSSFGPRFANLGVMEFNDFVGLDLVRTVEGRLFPDLERATAPMPILEEKVARGEKGMKSGKGFYDWSAKSIEDIRRRRDRGFVDRVKNGGA